jgi:GNAT superfamily N-acetyltransferase
MNIAQTTVPARHKLVNQTLENIDFGLALPSDAGELARLHAQFFGEARYKDRGIVYSESKAEAWLGDVIQYGSCPHIIARTPGYQGEIVGVISYTLDDTFCEEPVAVLHTFYVVPKHRRSAIGRVLVALVTEMAEGDGACAFHAPLASGMVETGSLINLFTRAGFTEIGTIMGRSL